MITTRFEFDTRSWNRGRAQLQAIRERAQNARPAWEAFLDWFAYGNRRQFGTRGARWRTPWRELKPATVAQKRSLGYTTDILIREGTLMRSVADRPLNIERVGPHDMEAGTALKYAKYHHFGAPRARIPKRPLWSEKQIREEGAATSAVRSWIIDGDARVTARTPR